jgi:hypothetical protein
MFRGHVVTRTVHHIKYMHVMHVGSSSLTKRIQTKQMQTVNPHQPSLPLVGLRKYSGAPVRWEQWRWLCGPR